MNKCSHVQNLNRNAFANHSQLTYIKSIASFSGHHEQLMIICSCNALSHKDVESAIDAGASKPSDIYSARKCRAQCGNCVPGMVCLLKQALKDRRKLQVAVSQTSIIPKATEQAAYL
ncbi:(2Fe-2S)-binding protein [Gluconobacter frateurii]